MTTPMTDSIGPPRADGCVPVIWMPYVPVIVASLHPRFFFGPPFACTPDRHAPARVTRTATPTTTVPRSIRISSPFVPPPYFTLLALLIEAGTGSENCHATAR